MVFFGIIFLILSFVPILLFGFFSFILNFKLKLVYYYLIELIIVLFITSIAQIYYYQTYDLNVFPSGEYFIFFLIFPVLAMIFYYLFDVIRCWVKKKQRPSIKMSIILLVSIILFFNWFVPLGQKYYHVKRLKVMEENFTKKDSKRVTIDGDIMITLVESEYDKIMQPRFRSSSVYNNYFYIRNSGNESVTGSVYLILFNKNNQLIDAKVLPEIELDAQTTQLLVFDEQKIMNNEWDQHSFGTQQKVGDFTSTITLEK